MARYLKHVLFFLVVSLILIGASGQDENDKKKDEDKKKPLVHYDIDVELRLVDVIVLDDDDEHVTDLTIDDFELYEDGELQELVTFDNLRYRVKKPGAAAPKIPADEEKDKKVKPAADKVKKSKSKIVASAPPEAIGRSIILLFDNFNTHYPHLQKAKKAAKKFIMDELLPEDRIAIIRYYGSVKILQDFTDDKVKLFNAINTMKLSLGDVAVGRPEIADESLEMYGGQDTGTHTIENLKGGPGGVFTKPWEMGMPENMNKSMRRDQEYATGKYWDPWEKYYNVKNFMSTLKATGLVLKDIPGRKTIIFMSPGFLGVNPKNMPFAYIHMSNVMQKLSGYNITLYSVDVSGVATVPEGKRNERWDFLTYVAEQTGGKLFKNNNNLLKQLQKVNYEISKFYLLGYKSKNIFDDGRFIKVEIKCKRPNTEVRTVRGLFAARSWDNKTFDERKSELTRELNIGKPMMSLPIKINRVTAIPAPDGKIVYPLIVKFPIFHDFERYELLSYDLLLRIKDAQKDEVQSYFEEIRVDKATIIGDEFIVNFPLLLDSGEHSIELAVKNNINHLIGTKYFKVDIPEKIKGFAVTDPQLFTTLKKSTIIYPNSAGRVVKEEYYPHVGKSLLPVTGRKLYRNEETILFVGLVNYGMDYKGESADVEIEFVFKKYGEVIQVPVEVRKFYDGEKKDVMSVLMRIPRNALASGRYTLEIYCTDNTSGKIMRKDMPLFFTARRAKRAPVVVPGKTIPGK